MLYGVTFEDYPRMNNDRFINILGVIILLIKTEKGEKCAKGKKDRNKQKN